MNYMMTSERARNAPATAAYRKESEVWAKKFEEPKRAPAQAKTGIDLDYVCYNFARWFAAAILKNEPLVNRLGGPGPFPITRAAGTSPNSIGGSIVPDAATPLIIALRAASGVCRQNCQVVPMTSDTLPVPRRTTGLTVSFIGEGQALPESQNVFDSVTLTVHKAAAFMRMSTEVSEDSIADWGAYLIQELSTGFSLFEDNVWINADGTSQFYGMRGLTNLFLDGQHSAGTLTAASGHNTFLTLDNTDVTGLMGLLPDYAWPGAKWYCSNYAAATLLARLGAIGGGTVMTQAGRRPQLMYAGIPIVQTSKMNSASTTQAGKVMLILGDASMATMIGYDRQMTIASSYNRYLEIDQIAVRATSRFSIVSHSVGDNSTPGAMVALLGGS